MWSCVATREYKKRKRSSNTSFEPKRRRRIWKDTCCITSHEKNISIVGRLIAEYKYNGYIDKFTSEEIRQAILPIGRDYPVNVREYANRLVEKEKM